MPRKTRQPTRSSMACPRRFNEAAARCRGKLAVRRPSGAAAAGFNEAAARCRGKQRDPLRGRDRGRRFNEAAARCRGKLDLLFFPLRGGVRLQ